MTADNFVITWRLADSNNLPVDFENKLYPVITYYRYETNSSGQYPTYTRLIDILKCNETFANVPQFTENFPVKDYFFMNWSEDNFTFGGNWVIIYIILNLKFIFAKMVRIFLLSQTALISVLSKIFLVNKSILIYCILNIFSYLKF